LTEKGQPYVLLRYTCLKLLLCEALKKGKNMVAKGMCG